MIHDTWQAFFDTTCTLEPEGQGVLRGTTFAAKEAFDVKGFVTSGGNPDWYRTHSKASETARAITQLVQAGSRLVGKTHTDELMYGLNGENVHYGTPVNPKAPDRIPGGSSSGSASAVAGKLVDFAIGTDTGGSVRIPASYTGIYGFRPTIGRISLEGVIPLSQTFDTVGCLARDPSLLENVSSVLLDHYKIPSGHSFSRVVVASDAISRVDQELVPEVEAKIAHIASSFLTVQHEVIAEPGLETWSQAFRIIQGYDIWQNFGTWITETKPHFGPGFHERFYWTRTITREERDKWAHKQKEWREELWSRLRQDTLIVLPTAPGVAPLKNTPLNILNPFRDRVLQLTCIAGLGGLPQVSMPLLTIQGIPFGISVIAGPGMDEELLAWVRNWVIGEGIEC